MRRNNQIIREAFGKNPLEGIGHYNAQKRMDKVRRYHDAIDALENEKWKVDEITWNDLEMDQIFLRVNHTNSFIGEQVLYHKLHVLDKGRDAKKADLLEKRIQYLQSDEQKRIEIESHLSFVNKREEAYYLSEFLLDSTAYKIGNTFVYHILQALLVLFVVLWLISKGTLALVGVVAIAIINMSIYIEQKRKYEVFFSALAELKGVYDFAKWLERFDNQNMLLTEEGKQAIRNLNGMSKIIYGMNSRMSASMTGDVLALFREYFWGIFLLDVSMFNHILKIIENKQEDVLKLLEFVGTVDADIAVLSYRKSVDMWCQPTFDSEGIEGKQLAHPLLNHPVTNDFALYSRAMITGANASGKSTFMKSVAVNVLLAQTIHTSIAETMRLKPLMIMTCMSLRDDIITGESYYFREAKYLKRIMDTIEKEPNVLIVIDEILKGTNTKERIAASKAILEYIGMTKSITLVATHDNELTESTQYEYYYFDSEIEANDVCFDYRIHEGKNTSSNAIALLECLGYPKRIVENARNYWRE